jgi:hypothetical protein
MLVELLFLLVAVQICGWLLQRRNAGRIPESGLRQTFIGAALVFIAMDEGVPLLTHWLNSGSAGYEYPISTAIVAVLIDLTIVAFFVYVTVPMAARLCRRNAVA